MRNIILLIALLIAAKSFAVKTYSVVTEIVERDTDNELSFTKKKLKNLLSTDKFEGKYFKIVKGTGDDPILNDGSLDAQKAANVYYLILLKRILRPMSIILTSQREGQLQ